MKRYTWTYKGDVGTFFRKLGTLALDVNAVSPRYWQSYPQFYDGKYFYFVRKKDNRFILHFHSNFFRKGPFLSLYGRAEQLKNGVRVKATMRMMKPTYVTQTLFYAMLVFGIINTAFIEPEMSGSVIPLCGVLLATIVLNVLFMTVGSNTKGIVALMNKLHHVTLPAPELEQKPRKVLTRQGLVYRYPKLHIAPNSTEPEEKSSRTEQNRR